MHDKKKNLFCSFGQVIWISKHFASDSSENTMFAADLDKPRGTSKSSWNYFSFRRCRHVRTRLIRFQSRPTTRVCTVHTIYVYPRYSWLAATKSHDDGTVAQTFRRYIIYSNPIIGTQVKSGRRCTYILNYGVTSISVPPRPSPKLLIFKSISRT